MATSPDSLPVRPRSFAAPVLAFLLFALVFALFSPAIRYDFVDFDDPSYILGNNLVHPGLTLRSVLGAFGSPPDFAAMYMPLLWISYMADITLFGASIDNPAPFHAVNVALHAANAVLFFFLLRLLLRILSPALATRRPALVTFLPPFFLSLLWAVHPLRAESVAWITERKDVLSLFFALLSLLSYLKAFRSRGRGEVLPSPRVPPGAGFVFFTLSFLCFAASLLSKPALVPFPLILLLFDVLVLRRPLSFRLFLSKAHFFILSAAAALATLAGHAPTVVPLPLRSRVFHVPQILSHYLQVFVFPSHLTLFDPRPAFGLLPALLDALLLLALFLFALRLRRAAPLVCLGVFWFFLFLLPVSGLATIPNNLVADRFSYVPDLGLSIALLAFWASSARVGGKSEASPGQTPSRVVFVLFSAVCALFAFLSFRLLPVWRSSDALCNRIRGFSPHNPLVAVYDIEKAIGNSGDFPVALRIARDALEHSPGSIPLEERLATCIANIEGPLPAIECLLPLRPAPGLFLGGWAWHMAHLSLRLGRTADALAYADIAEANLPAPDTRHANIQRLRAAATSSDSAAAVPHAISQWMLHERNDALETFRHLAAAYPSRPDFLANIAWILATADWSPAPPSEALEYATRSIAIAGNQAPPGLFDTYAAALANASDFTAAAAAQKRAISLLPPDSPSLPDYQARLALYEHSAPYRHDIGISW